MRSEKICLKKPGEVASDKRQIYIVDDDESVCLALKVLLVSYAFKVEAYHSAERFFSAVPNSAPGCLILDLHMPGLKGWEACQRLIKSGSKRPFIIITADNDHKLKWQVLKAGAAGYLQKPFNDNELVELIQQVIED